LFAAHQLTTLVLEEEKMAFCGKCGTQLHENATFCANCGTPTGVSAQAVAGGTPVVTHPIAAGGPPSRGFFASLFDLSFSNFVTTKLVKVLFVLAIIGAVLEAIAVIVYTNSPVSPVSPVIGIIAAPVIFFVIVLAARVYMEIIMVTFRGVEYLRELVEQGRGRG
jgi:Domain of unknown function (DUF4282)/zinc-ribbon domain